MNDFDDFHFKVPSCVKQAGEILDMYEELKELRREVAELREYRKKYSDELTRGIEHSQHMIGSIFQLAMTPGVLTVIKEHNQSKEEA